MRCLTMFVESSRTVFLKIAMLIALIGLGMYWGLCVDAGELTKPDIRVVVSPTQPAANQPVELFATGMLPSWAYSVSNGTAEVRGNEIHVDLPIIALMIYIEDPEPVKVHEPIARFMLEEGEYTVHSTISMEEQPPFTFTVGPPVEIDFETTAPFFDASIQVDPPKPSPGEDVFLRVTGLLPDTSWSVTQSSFEIENEIIFLRMETESDGIGLDVLTPVEEVFSVGPLAEGVYVVTLEVNGITADKASFRVFDRPIDGELIPLPPDFPVSNIHNAMLIAEPNPAQPGDAVRFTLDGEFSTPGYSIEILKPLSVDGDAISAVVNIIEPTEEIMITVTDPFRFELGELVLDEGLYYAYVATGNNRIAMTRVVVGDPVLPAPVPPRPHTPHPAMVMANPSPAEPGETVNFTLKGEFPTPGYAIELIEPLAVEGHSITAVVNIVEPIDEFLPTVIDPFEFELGELSLEEGMYALTVFAVAPEMPIAHGRLQVGERSEWHGGMPRPVLVFDREGGFAGSRSWLQVSTDGEIIRHDAFNSPAEENGTIPMERWLEIRDFFDAIPFDQLPDRFWPETPIADGFTYSIEYAGRTIIVDEGAEVPVELEAALVLLIELLGDPLEDMESTHVDSWLLH